MNKKIMFFLLTIALVVLTIHSAIAVQTVPLSTNITITSQPVTTATVGQAYSYQVVISNPDNEPVTYGLVQAPTGMQISSAGLVTWNPTIAGTNSVNISVTGETGIVYQAYTIISTALPATLTVGSLDLGSSSQERGEFILNQAWTLKNTGSYAITISSVQHTVSSRYNFSLSTTQLTLQPGEEKNILATAYVPENQNAGKIKIGQITILGTTSNGQQIAATKDVYLEVENNLVIDEIEVKVGSKKDTLTSPGTVDETAEYDDKITVTVGIKNTYTTGNADTQMRDITMELLSSDLDVADGLDDSLSRLDAGKKDDSMTVSFILDPTDINPNDAPFEFDVEIKGETRNGAQHGETWTLKLDMNVDSRDVRIISATVSPSTISCTDNRRVRIDTKIRNLGTRDLDTAMLRFIMDGYDVSAWERDISLDQGDSDEITVYLDIPRTVPVGNYYIDIKAYPTSTTSTTTDTEAVLITVAECQTTTPPPNDDDDDSNDNQINTTYIPVQGTPVSSNTGSNSGLFGNDVTYIVLLAVLVVLMFVAVLLLVFRMTKN